MPRPNTEPSRDKQLLVAALDREIDETKESMREAGATSWVALAALASLCWVLFDQVGRPGFHLASASLCYAYTAVAGLGILFAGLVFAPTKRRLPFQHRYSTTAYAFGASRLSLVTAILLFGLPIAIFLHENVPLPHKVNVVLILGLIEMLTIFSLYTSFLDQPILNVHAGSLGRSGRSAAALAASLLLVVAVDGCIRHYDAVVDGIGPNIRTGLILFSMLSVIEYVLPKPEAVLRDSLHHIRRELLLGKLSTAEAKSQFETTLLGLRLSDIFAKDIARILELKKLLNQQELAFASLLESMIPFKGKSPNDWTPEEREQVERISKQVMAVPEELGKCSREMHAAIEQFIERLRKTSLHHQSAQSDLAELMATFDRLLASINSPSDIAARVRAAGEALGIEREAIDELLASKESKTPSPRSQLLIASGEEKATGTPGPPKS